MSAEENQKQKAKKKMSRPHCSVLNLLIFVCDIFNPFIL